MLQISEIDSSVVYNIIGVRDSNGTGILMDMDVDPTRLAEMIRAGMPIEQYDNDTEQLFIREQDVWPEIERFKEACHDLNISLCILLFDGSGCHFRFDASDGKVEAHQEGDEWYVDEHRGFIWGVFQGWCKHNGVDIEDDENPITMDGKTFVHKGNLRYQFAEFVKDIYQITMFLEK